MGPLRLLLRDLPPRCACTWSEEGHIMTLWHVCTRPPHEEGDHACPGDAQAGAA